MRSRQPARAGRKVAGKAGASGRVRTDAVRPRLILVPVDFSKAANRALDYAAGLARLLGSEIRILHVIESTAVATETMQWVDFYDQVRSLVEPMIANVADRISRQGVQVHTALARGAAYQEIVRQARRHGAGLIVMGTHGRTGLGRWFMGSVTERVVRMAHCPVLCLRS